MKRAFYLPALAILVLAAAVGLAVYSQPRFGAATAQSSTGQAGASRSGAGAAQFGAAGQTPAAPAGITVIGNGTARLAPDVAYVTVGVQTQAATARDAQDANSAAMTEVLKRLAALKIADKDVQTNGVGLFPLQKDTTVTGYQATSSVTVQVQDVTLVGQVLDAAVAGGANTASNVRFGLRDPGAANRQALEAAAKDAQAKADAVAKALGVQIKAVDSAVEDVTTSPQPFDAVGRVAAVAPGSAVPVEPGEVVTTARLRVTYSW